MKSKSIWCSVLAAISLLTVGLPSANAVIIYGVVWADANKNGMRDEDEGVNDLDVVITSSAFAPAGSLTLTPDALSSSVGIFGEFNTTLKNGAYFWGAGTAATTFTVSVTRNANYSAFITPNSSSGSWDGVTGGNGANGAGRFGDSASVDLQYLSAGSSQLNDFDSDVNLFSGLTGSYTWTFDADPTDYGVARIDIGLVPVPEPANVALLVFGGLVVGFSALRRIRARKSQDCLAVATV